MSDYTQLRCVQVLTGNRQLLDEEIHARLLVAVQVHGDQHRRIAQHDDSEQDPQHRKLFSLAAKSIGNYTVRCRNDRITLVQHMYQHYVAADSINSRLADIVHRYTLHRNCRAW